ncbi:MAG: isopentenyl-diphosphate Delta-isomerase [Oscillospiraceae bacterium]|nr:isopentenyl-diphosphate Delta-isomerase [Oscillospiraceae bacterium]
MEDQLICVDIFDNEIGSAPKLEAHQKCMLHRAFSVFLVNEGRMLIQRRAAHKYHSGGKWANACCSHPRVGESLQLATERRMQEELNLSGIELQELYGFVYCHQFEDGLWEYEYDHVFVGQCDTTPELNPEEADACRWVEYDELAKELLEHPDRFAVWFRICAPKVLARLKEQT